MHWIVDGRVWPPHHWPSPLFVDSNQTEATPLPERPLRRPARLEALALQYLSQSDWNDVYRVSGGGRGLDEFCFSYWNGPVLVDGDISTWDWAGPGTRRHLVSGDLRRALERASPPQSSELYWESWKPISLHLRRIYGG